jgi:hypothetical protein
LGEIVENSLKAAVLWDEVKDRLHTSALRLSGGQQQRLCIARIVIMIGDEPPLKPLIDIPRMLTGGWVRCDVPVAYLVPGLNSVIKGVVYRGSESEIEVTGIRRGWEGLTHVNLEDPLSRARYVLPLNRANTRTIDRTGGTFLHTSRTNPARIRDSRVSRAATADDLQP